MLLYNEKWVIWKETLIKIFGIFQMENSQFDCILIEIKVEFFSSTKKGMDSVIIIIIISSFVSTEVVLRCFPEMHLRLLFAFTLWVPPFWWSWNILKGFERSRRLEIYEKLGEGDVLRLEFGLFQPKKFFLIERKKWIKRDKVERQTWI